MHQDSTLLATFVVALVAAFLGGIVARMVRLPPVVGYLLGGLAVGPFTPGFIGDSHAMSQLAEVGVMLGLSVSIASTVALIKNLADAGLAGTDGGRIATVWLIVEDLLTVVILVVLPVSLWAGRRSRTVWLPRRFRSRICFPSFSSPALA